MGSWAPEHAQMTEKNRIMVMIICAFALMIGAHRLYLHCTMKDEERFKDEE